jgi:hypothetical protein
MTKAGSSQTTSSLSSSSTEIERVDDVKSKSAFGTDTAFERVDDRQFLATVTDRWNGMHGQPLGGYVLAVALQPLRSQMPYPDLLVSSAFFLLPVTAGPVEILAELARVGWRTATGETDCSRKEERRFVRPLPSPTSPNTRTQAYRLPTHPFSPQA